jgi:hypothetical protein
MNEPKHIIAVADYVTNENGEVLLVKTHWRSDTKMIFLLSNTMNCFNIVIVNCSTISYIRSKVPNGAIRS